MEHRLGVLASDEIQRCADVRDGKGSYDPLPSNSALKLTTPIHISSYNLGLIMRLLTGFGTPRRWADANIANIWLRYPIDDQTVGLLGCPVVTDGLYRGTVLASDLVLFNL